MDRSLYPASDWGFGQWLWREAFVHADHLCNGACPDFSDPGMKSRDPQCFYCNVMDYIERRQVIDREL